MLWIIKAKVYGSYRYTYNSWYQQTIGLATSAWDVHITNLNVDVPCL
jgi:hypothetical protein